MQNIFQITKIISLFAKHYNLHLLSFAKLSIANTMGPDQTPIGAVRSGLIAFTFMAKILLSAFEDMLSTVRYSWPPPHMYLHCR